MDEKELMGLVTSEYSWEQVIYKIVAWEGLDPWDLDLSAFSRAFIEYLEKLEELDFKIPAKYLIIAAVLLRMKSDHLHFLELLNPDEEIVNGGVIEVGDAENSLLENNKFEINPINVPPKRLTKKRIMVEELVTALKKVLKTQENKEQRTIKMRKDIHIEEDTLTQRIDELYNRINALLARIKGEEVKFSQLVKNRKKKEIIDIFVPLIYLESAKKLECKQEEIFSEIYIKKV